MIRTPLYRDRTEAGRRLALRLATHYEGRIDVVVLALPRGGVPVGYEVARVLDAPLDVFLVRKLGVPGQRELAMGAIATGAAPFLDRDLISTLQIPDRWIDVVIEDEQRELARRTQAFRGDRPPLRVQGKTVIVVDDGLATGSTMRMAVRALRAARPARIVAAVPVGSRSAVEALEAEVDEVVCLATPDPFLAVGRFYDDFTLTSDREVHDLIERAARRG